MSRNADPIPPTKNAIKKPGEWNQYRITCLDNKITVALNGQQVIDLDLSDSPLKDRHLEGHIGFQDEAKRVWYRNVRIKELP